MSFLRSTPDLAKLHYLWAFKMCEQLCLQWEDYQENIRNAFRNLRDDNHFTDVTLVSEDGQQVEAHKVILAATSPFFQRLLERHKHPQPLVYMKGVKIEDLSAVVDFLYFGEARIKAEDVNSFLAIAKELQLRGLLGEVEENLENALNMENTLIHEKSKLKAKPKAKSSIRPKEDVKREQTDEATTGLNT